MAQNRNRPTLTLTVSRDVVDAVRDVLGRIPGKPVSISVLVEGFLTQWAFAMRPFVEDMEKASPVERLALLHQMFGQQVAEVAGQFLQIAREVEDEKKGS